MKNQRTGFLPNMMPFQGQAMENMPTNMMMFPNYMNDNYDAFENRISNLEKKIKTLENRISRLETPYQNNANQQYQTPQQQAPYQATQNSGYNGDMYMM